jgi:hypothetical protein
VPGGTVVRDTRPVRHWPQPGSGTANPAVVTIFTLLVKHFLTFYDPQYLRGICALECSSGNESRESAGDDSLNRIHVVAAKSRPDA